MNTRSETLTDIQLRGITCPENTDLGSKVARPQSTNEVDDEPYVAIDYTMSVSQVYQQFTKYMINKYRTLDVICVLNTYRCITIDAPTWMPDWREHPVAKPSSEDNFDYLSNNFATAGDTLPEMQDPLAWGNLQVTGCRVDLVKDLLDFSTNVYGIKHIHKVLGSSTATNEEYAENIDRVLESGNKEDPEMIKAFFSSPDYPRRCYRTVAGRVCIVPRWALAGDGIWILQGARLPFVLRSGYRRGRQVHEESLREFIYEVVGPCCAPDLTNGKFYNHYFGKPGLGTTTSEDTSEGGPILKRLTLV